MTSASADGAVRISRLTDVGPVEEPANHLMLRMLVGGDDEPGLSIVHVHIDGPHRPLQSRRTLRYYVVLEGSLTLRTWRAGHRAADVHRLDRGDVASLPVGTCYALEGRAEYLVLNVPAFREGDDGYLDELPETP